jgi:hypothetical protein
MEQIFPLSFDLIEDNRRLNIVGFDKSGTIKQIQMVVPIVGLVNINSPDDKWLQTSEVKSFRKCYSGLIFDLYPLSTKADKNVKNVYKVVTDSSYDLNWFSFACNDVTPLYEHLPSLALLLRHLNIKPYQWIDYMPLAPPMYGQINNSFVAPEVNLSTLAASLCLDDFDRRRELSSLWCCPINLVDTKYMPLHFLAWYFPTLTAKSPITVDNNRKFPDSYIAKLFGIQNKVNFNDKCKDPYFYRLYRLIDMGYYPSSIDINQALPFNVDVYNPKHDSEIHIRKEELFFPPLHLKPIVTRLRLGSKLPYNDIYTNI